MPYSYRVSDFFNAVQWAAGLELFLLCNDPMQVFFTTDHPNGAPFTTYPEVFALLMSADKRAQYLLAPAGRGAGAHQSAGAEARIYASTRSRP